MEEEDDMEDGDLEDLDGEGLNEPFFFEISQEHWRIM